MRYKVLTEGIPPGETFTTGTAQEGVRSYLVHVLDVLTDVFLGHECFAAKWTLLRSGFAADFDVSGEICAMCVTSPTGGALVRFKAIVLVHVTFKLDLMPEASITNLALKCEFIFMQSNVIP